MKKWTFHISQTWVILVCLVRIHMGAVAPPKWANTDLNPCAKRSWQMLHWRQDDKCYPIFTQGPCQRMEELFFNHKLGTAECRCAKGSIRHDISQKCYPEYTRGPCGKREYLAKPRNSLKTECLPYNYCKPGYLYWPRTKSCYQQMSQGPCGYGELIHVNSSTGETNCGCVSSLMDTNFWFAEKTCHELFKRGPCIDGQLFVYNLRTDRTECSCSPAIRTNYYQSTARCYELNSIGPCRQGQIFTFNSTKLRTECQCLPGYGLWQRTNTCHREYTRGPCNTGYYFMAVDHASKGFCVANKCKQGQLYDPDTKRCYYVGQQGPCEKGKLWIFERASSIKGRCHCDPQLIGYWKPHGICYQIGKNGPCPKRKILLYDRKRNNVACRCDQRKGYVSWIHGDCLKIGVSKRKLVPVAGPSKNSVGSNSIFRRVHRGLTLPDEAGKKLSQPSKTESVIVQEGILNDILKHIRS